MTTMISPTMPTSHRPRCAAWRWPSCPAAGETDCAACRRSRERQVGQARVDHRPGQRLQPGAGARRLAGDAERGLAQPPEGVGREADAEQPERNQPVGLAREQLQGALLIRLPRALAQRDEQRDPADQDVDDTRAVRPARARKCAARLSEACLAWRFTAGGRYGIHTRLYLDSVHANS